MLRYLGRYTHRVAISNARLVDLQDGTVRFRWKDYADHDRDKVMALSADEFLRRCLLHVVPRGFVRIRYFGLLANRQRRASLDRCRAVLAAPTPASVPEPPPITSAEPSFAGARCPYCGVGVMRVTALHASAPPPVPGDSS